MAAIFTTQALLLSLASLTAASNCRCFPGDSCWPSVQDWNNFNASIDGQLISTVPLAAPCHDPQFNEAVCDSLRNNWLEPSQHYNNPSSIMAPFFTNGSCDPFHPESSPCLLGNYAVYSVNVTKPDHISKAITFATKRNIRLVVKNTGHDYNGKSTGAGSLSLWTHNLKDIQIKDYNSTYYTGKAIKMGAGVQGFEAYQAAHNNGLQVVGGECPTVGIAGGYTQGGGHSALASKYGLAADQTLEWEVIDGNGVFRTVTRDSNPDLYWALSGGGGGTYGVVWSLTSKAHPDIPVSGFNLTFTNEGVDQDTYYEAIKSYHATLPAIVDSGTMSVWYFTNTSFAISPLTGPGVPVDKLLSILQPFLDKLNSLGIKYQSYSQQFSGYLEQFTAMQGPIEVGIAQYGGWLVQRSVVETNNDALTEVYRNITEDGAQFIGVGINVSKAVVGDVYNAVLPAWRGALIDTVLTTPWSFTAPISDMIANQVKMTKNYIPQMEAISPGSGAYMNEADFRQPDYKQAFFGANYDKLLQIKSKYDPQCVFYARTAVGSDEWIESDDGRLCRA